MIPLYHWHVCNNEIRLYASIEHVSAFQARLARPSTSLCNVANKASIRVNRPSISKMQACTCSFSASMARTLFASKAISSSLSLQLRTGATRAAKIPPPTAATAAAGGSYMKTFKPLTPGLRHVRQPVHPHLHKGKPQRDLTVAKRGTGGRNNTGRVVTRFRGGGHKRRIRLVDFKRLIEGQQTVERIEYDPGRTAHIALLKHDASGEVSYILAPDGLRAGDKVQSWPRGVIESASEATGGIDTSPSAPQSVNDPTGQAIAADGDVLAQPKALTTSLLRASMLRTGNQLPLHLIPPGTTIHCIALRPQSKATLCRSAGSSAKMVASSSAGAKGSHFAQVQLTSGEVRKINRNATAVIGSVSNKEHQHKQLGKAGRARWLGRKPRNRGVSMNA